MNITEYIEKNGKYSLEQRPFNYVDSLILAQLSYLKFDGLVGGFPQKYDAKISLHNTSHSVNINTKESEVNDDDISLHKSLQSNVKLNESLYSDDTISLHKFETSDYVPEKVRLKDLLHADNKSGLFRDERYAYLNEPLFNAACNSTRFGGMVLSNFTDIVDEERMIQFSAITVQFGNGVNCVVFRGTDDNIIGWKEDLDMSYEMVIPAQDEAVKYLNQAAGSFSGDMYILGHSKGGNLAVYSSMMVDESIKQRIIAIHSHDGPGFMPDVLKSSSFNEIKSKITKLVPKSSLVGLLLTTGEKYEVVESQKIGAMQHSPFNWIIEDFDFKRADNIDTYAKLHERALSIWTENMTPQQFKYLSDEAYKILTDSGISNLNDFNDDFFGSVQSLIQTAGHLDDEAKENMKNIFSVLKAAAKLAAYENARKDFDGAVKNARTDLNKALEKAKKDMDEALENASANISHASIKVRNRSRNTHSV